LLALRRLLRVPSCRLWVSNLATASIWVGTSRYWFRFYVSLALAQLPLTLPPLLLIGNLGIQKSAKSRKIEKAYFNRRITALVNNWTLRPIAGNAEGNERSDSA